MTIQRYSWGTTGMVKDEAGSWALQSELEQLERYKKALQTANGFLIMNNLEPVKLEYGHQPTGDAKCLRDIGFNMQCQEPEGHVGPCRWHRPTAFG